MGRPRKISTLTQISGAMDSKGAPISPSIEENGRPIPPGVGPRTAIEPPKSKEEKLDPTREKKAGDEAVVPDLPILNNNPVPSKPKSPLGNSTLSGMSQTHGQVETFRATTLAQILGDKGMHKYKTVDLGEYTGRINGMNKADLQAHAAEVGLVPIDDRVRMSKRLVQEFQLHVSSFKHPSTKRLAPNPMSPEVAKILAGGR